MAIKCKQFTLNCNVAGEFLFAKIEMAAGFSSSLVLFASGPKPMTDTFRAHRRQSVLPTIGFQLKLFV
jgi:hypothetical protein